MTWQSALVVVAAVGAAIDAGAFFAFSSFVMPALDDLAPAEGAAAMQAINRRAPSALFVGTIIGAGPVALPALVSSWDATSSTRWLLAAVLLSIASAVITVTANVPRNSALADADSSSVGAVWAEYLVSWTRWNTARTVTSTASVAAFVLTAYAR